MRACMCVFAGCTHLCVCLGVVIRLWRWCLCIEGSCPVCQRALSATLFSDKASVKGLTPTGHGCRRRVVGGGEQQQQQQRLSSCLVLPAEKRLSEPPSPLLRLVDSLHRHPGGRPYLTLSQHVHSWHATHTSSCKQKKPSDARCAEITKLENC